MSSGSGEQVGVASGVRYEPSPDEAIADELGSWPGANINNRGGRRPKRQSLLVQMLRLLGTGQSVEKPPDSSLCNQLEELKEKEREEGKEKKKKQVR